MRAASLAKFVLAIGIFLTAFSFAAQPAKANWWYRGGWGPGIVVRVGPPVYPYYRPHPYYYASGAYYRRRPYWAPRPYYYGYRPYYARPVIGFGVTIY
jgi:hypothetical protein